MNETKIAKISLYQERMGCSFSFGVHLDDRNPMRKTFILFVIIVIMKVIYCREYLYSIIAEPETQRKWLKP